MSQFELITKCKDMAELIPVKATLEAGCYDLMASKEIIIPSYIRQVMTLKDMYNRTSLNNMKKALQFIERKEDVTLRPIVVPTGVKCKLDEGKFLALVPRSSLSTKALLIMSNSIGVIDKDYYNNNENEGEIGVPLLNLSPVDIVIHKGDRIAQAFEVTVNDIEKGLVKNLIREGGYGSTGVK